ncbi:hypothetical protein E0485_06265 [Paenibacillus albiflavus]|uniref:YgiT-type zinc finger protein n=1 Tax=Paenibacillus albiflavus TaxID=2545760 RepID=A0A4R4EJL8_9BACL|nr:hypothetical protein [Paenibacillus albiflavus]TCZ79460.1 hypothetical protein E0485_06265 [Paenibacillus albiflavus]
MEKLCSCGNTVMVQLSTVIYHNLVTIEGVPIYACNECGSNEIHSAVKLDLKKLIEKHEQTEEKIIVHMEEFSEVSYFYKQMLESADPDRSIPELIEERINELLDTYILAKSLSDQIWTDDIYKRLLQLNTLKSQYDTAVS